MHDRTITFRGDWLDEIERASDSRDAPAHRHERDPDDRLQKILPAVLFFIIMMASGLALANWLSSPASSTARVAVEHVHTELSAKVPHAPARSQSPASQSIDIARHHALLSATRDGIPGEMFDYYYRFGHRFGLPWQLLAAIGTNETGNGTSTAPGVHSDVGYSGCCGGVMELCFTTSCGNAAKHYGVDGDGDGAFSIFDDADSVATAANILASFKKIWGSDMTLLMAAYNAGPEAVKEYHGVPPYEETENYVIKGDQTLKRLGYGGGR